MYPSPVLLSNLILLYLIFLEIYLSGYKFLQSSWYKVRYELHSRCATEISWYHKSSTPEKFSRSHINIDLVDNIYWLFIFGFLAMCLYVFCNVPTSELWLLVSISLVFYSVFGFGKKICIIIILVMCDMW